MSSSSPSPAHDATPPPRVRAERSWCTATEPLFLLNSQRRLIYANSAWESATGVAFAEARGRTCRRRPAGHAVEPVEQVLAALTPPPEARRGRTCQTRRRAPGKKLSWWEIDFFPWSSAAGVLAMLGKLRVVAETGPAHAALPDKLVQLQVRHRQSFTLTSWHSDVPAMRRLVEQIRLAAQTATPVLILGPPGAGKEWAARTIHHLSQRSESFCACLDSRLPPAAFAEILASSRHSRVGALYLKSVESLPRDVQELLLNHLDADATETGPRLLAGSSADLDEEVKAGRMLPMLQARLGVLQVQVPALKDRLPDMPQLAGAMLSRVVQATESSIDAVSSATLDLFQRHAWPGNLRELFEVLVQARRLAKTSRLEADDLPFYLRQVPVPPEKSLALDDTLAKVEHRLIELAMRLAQGNKTRAADLLAIWRPRLSRRLEQLGMAAKENEP